MIAEVSTSASFGTLTRYLESGRAGERVPYAERVQHAETVNMLARPGDTGLIAREMRDRAARSDQVEKPVLHLILSFKSEDDPGTERRFEAGRRMLDRLGLGDHQAYIVSHKNENATDLHIEVNRVGRNGRAWSTSWDYARVEAAADDVSKKMGLRRIARHWYSQQTEERAEKNGWTLPRPGRDGATSAERRRQRETGERPLSQRVQEAAKPIFDQAGSWIELQTRLAEIGAQVMPKGRGGVVAPLSADGSTDAPTVKLSSIGRQHSWGRLANRFGNFERFQQEQEMLADKQRGQPVDPATLIAHDRLEEPPATTAHALTSMHRADFSAHDYEHLRRPPAKRQRQQRQGRTR